MSFGKAHAQLVREVAELKRGMANLFRMGTVHEVDAKKGTVRLKFEDENGKPFLGPHIPWMEQGGALKTWRPPSKGQTMVAINPLGDQRLGFVINGSFSDANKQPSEKGDENVETFGDNRLTLDANGWTLKGNLKVDGNVDFLNGYVKSNGVKIDDTHGHVSAPPGPPGPPVS